MGKILTLIGRAFPQSVTHHHHAAALETEAGDRLALANMIPKRNNPMTTLSINAEVDTEIARHVAAADAAANSTGASFRDSMRKITELQSAEIERLRAIISDISKDRPRKPISVANRIDDNGRSRGAVAVCNDGTIWHTDGEGRHASWAQFPAIPQAADQLGD